MKKPAVISIMNRKGGSSKSTLSMNLAYMYGQNGYKVLLIDADPQASATQNLGIDRNIGNSPEIGINSLSRVAKTLREKASDDYEIDDLFGLPSHEEEEKSKYTGLHDLIYNSFFGIEITQTDIANAVVQPVYKVEMRPKEIKEYLKDRPADISDLSKKYYRTYKFGIDLLPSSEEVADDELDISLDQDERRAKMKGLHLANIIRAIKYYYDYDIILIDCPPSLGIMSINAMAASDGIVVAVMPDEQSLWSLQKLKKNVRQIKQKIPGHLGILGVAVNNAPRSSQIMPVISYKITSVLGLYQFKTVIHHSANAQKATAGGLLFSQIDGNANAEFEQLGKEILERHAVSTAWESYRRQQTDELLKKYKDDLEYRDMTDSEILDEIRKEYTRGDLWDKPKSIPDERYWKENK